MNYPIQQRFRVEGLAGYDGATGCPVWTLVQAESAGRVAAQIAAERYAAATGRAASLVPVRSRGGVALVRPATPDGNPETKGTP